MPGCRAMFDEDSPLTKGAARSDGGREAPGGCQAVVPKPAKTTPEGFAFFPLC